MRTYVSLAAVLLPPDAQPIDAARRRPIEIRLVRVDVPVQARVDDPLGDAEGGVEARREAVADGVVKVVAEDEVVAVDGRLGREAEGDAVLVLVLRVRLEVEVGGRGRGGLGQAAVGLASVLVGSRSSIPRLFGIVGGQIAYLDSDVEVDADVLRVDGYALGLVDGHDLMFPDVVVRAGSDLQHVVMRHDCLLIRFFPSARVT